MSNIFTNLGLLAGQNHFLAYFIIYLATILLGDITAFASIWLTLSGKIFGDNGLWFLLVAILLGYISGDLLWYSLGGALRDTRLGNFIIKRVRSHEKIEARLNKNAARLIFLSKFLYGAGSPIIFCSGWFRVGFKKFFKTAVSAVVLWLPFLVGSVYGLFVGLYSLRIIEIFRRLEVVFFVGLGAFFAADYFFAKLLKKWLDINGDNGFKKPPSSI